MHAKRIIALVMIGGVIAAQAQSLKQNVLNLTGNVYAKMVWVRTARNSPQH